jgi:hypothetical protein
VDAPRLARSKHWPVCCVASSVWSETGVSEISTRSQRMDFRALPAGPSEGRTESARLGQFDGPSLTRLAARR